jgi:hypothetical protein
MNLSTLTIEEARNVEAGAETDALVAEACGVPGELKHFAADSRARVRFCRKFTIDVAGVKYPGERPWEPSTDANHAIDAAKASIKNSDCEYIKLVFYDGAWSAIVGLCIGSTEPLIQPRGMGEAKEPALAICRAILERHVLGREAKV